MAQRPQGIKTSVVTSDTQVLATSKLNKNVYFISLCKINKGGASLLGEVVAIKDSVSGTVRWKGRAKFQEGDHWNLGRYGLNCPAGIYVQFTGDNAEVTVGYD